MKIENIHKESYIEGEKAMLRRINILITQQLFPYYVEKVNPSYETIKEFTDILVKNEVYSSIDNNIKIN